MSLVEKALRKAQDSKSTAPVALLQPVASLGGAGNRVAAGDTVGVPATNPESVVPPTRVIRVDRGRLRSVGLLPPEHQENELAAQYRQIKRPLIAAARGKGDAAIPNAQLIMVASSFPGEGKTFTCINLALSMALEKDISVVLVDADVAKAHLSRLFGVEKERGLLDALRDDTLEVEPFILPTDIPGLSILPAGSNAEHATELLASEHMQTLATRMIRSSPNRILLLDSPPLLLTSESRVLAHLAGQVALVVCANRTPQKAVRESLAHIGPDKYVGLILNQSTVKSQHGYYYGYGGPGDPSTTEAK